MSYGANVGLINNSGTITSHDDQGIFVFHSSIGQLNNSGNISSASRSAIFTYDSGSIGAVNNTGNISSSFIAIETYHGASIGQITNASNGYITSTYLGINNHDNSSIDSISNAGTISGYIAIDNDDIGSTIGSITNTGNIIGSNSGIFNVGTITTLNNSQGAGNNAGALTYSRVLPTNYNIIINSPSQYGQLSASNVTGNMAFNIYGNTGTTLVSGVNASTVVSNRYLNVLQGFSSLSSITGITGIYNGFNYSLVANVLSADSWDLLLVLAGPSAADTQSSLHSLASKLRSGFTSQAMATNFANMNTYDCNLFDAKGVCVSVGGQQTYVDNPSSNMTSTVIVGGYRVSPNIRIGGFLNQNINNNTVSSVHMSNANPLMGLFAVWNKNEDHMGVQLKVANAYQDKDVTTTRDVVGTSEAGTGSTTLNTQSYVGELSYAFMANEDKTLVRPYAAVRYTRIKQDGYTESSADYPLTYAALEDRSTTALVGVKLNHKLAEKVNLTASLGIEQDLYHHVDNLTATGVSGLTSENFNGNIKRTRPVASIGAYYMPVKNQRIAADVYYQQLPFQSTGSTTAYVNYTIGF